MRIDESNADALTNFNTKKKGKKVKASDHNSIFIELSFENKEAKAPEN